MRLPTRQEARTIRAALAYYHLHDLMDEPHKRPDEIHAIATNDDNDTSLDRSGYDELMALFEDDSHLVEDPEALSGQMEIHQGVDYTHLFIEPHTSADNPMLAAYGHDQEEAARVAAKVAMLWNEDLKKG